eukprot:9699603-Lingulodinium_polyedra.AAC.1
MMSGCLRLRSVLNAKTGANSGACKNRALGQGNLGPRNARFIVVQGSSGFPAAGRKCRWFYAL